MEKLEKIANIAQLAAVFEVCTEKPGNVNPSYDFHDTSYEDFISGSIAIGPAVKKAALQGFRAGRGKISLQDINVGGCIRDAVLDVKESHSGGNTHLGMLMLFIPIASAAGFCISRNSLLQNSLRESVEEILRNSTVEDSSNLYEAIKASNVGGLIGELKQPNISFHELMTFSSSRDRIGGELTTGMRIIFEIAVPALELNYRETRDFRKAVLQTYLILLSEFPDTFIARKVGLERAAEVSREAQMVLEKGSVFTGAGRSAIKEFDRKLRTEDSKLNPGTTADLVSAALFIWLLVEKF